MRSPGEGRRRFVPCSTGANHCRFRHIVFEECGHGLTSRPRESSSELFLDKLLELFRYPPESGRALLTGTLPLRYGAARFACKTPTCRLPVSGHVARLIAIFFAQSMLNYEGSTHPMSQLRKDAKRNCQQQEASCRRTESGPITLLRSAKQRRTRSQNEDSRQVNSTRRGRRDSTP